MAEFEELAIKVKVDEQKAAENNRQIKETFNKVTDPEHVSKFEKIAKSFNLNEVQIKQLNEAIGKTGAPLSNIAGLFTRGGLAFAAIAATIELGKRAHEALLQQADRQLEIAQAAERMGIMHAAQLEKNLEQMETVRIDRKRGEQMMETFANKRVEFLKHFSSFKQEIRDATRPDAREVLDKHFRVLEKLDAMDAANEIRKFARGIREYWEQKGDPGRGAVEERKYLERWFGFGDLQNLHEDFMRVTKEEQDAFDRNLRAAKDYVAITTDIKNNVDKIITSVLYQTLEQLHIMSLLQWIDRTLAANAEYIAQQETLPLEERDKEITKRILQENWDKQNAAFFEWLKSIFTGASSPDFGKTPKPEDFRQQHLLDINQDNQEALILEEKLLVENLRILNGILSGEAMNQLGPKFHNAPMGGAQGESNPVKLPADAAQPGGGAAAEARQQNAASADDPLAIANPALANRVAEAFRYIGKNETRDQKTLAEYMKTGGRDLSKDANAWCARFVNAVQTRAGLPSLESAVGAEESWSSLAYQRWGKAVGKDEQMQPGDVMIKRRGGASSGQGHVGMFTGNTQIDPKTGEVQYEMLSGNIGGKEKGGGEVNLTWGTLSTGSKGEKTKGAGHGPIVSVRRGIAPSRFATDETYSGPEEGAGKGKRLDPDVPATAESAAPRMTAQQLVGDSKGEQITYHEYKPPTDYSKLGIPGLQEALGSEQSRAALGDRDSKIPLEPASRYAVGWRGLPMSQNIENRRDIDPTLSATEMRLRDFLGTKPNERPEVDLPRPTEPDTESPGGYKRPRSRWPEKVDVPGWERPTKEWDPLDESGRDELDKHLNEQLDNIKARLNVEVDAPKGTEVKASGDGMFEKGVTVNRKISEPEQAAAGE